MYATNSLLIAGALLVLMLLAMELGYRLGRPRAETIAEPSKAHIHAMQASLLGVLALMLGFTFSLALQRYDKRSEAVITEANAIGTAYLRAQLLPASVRAEARALLRTYADIRLEMGTISIVRTAERATLVTRSNEALDALWSCGVRAAAEQDSVVRTGLFVQAIGDAMDAFSRRDAELQLHVPQVILLLLFVTFLATGGAVGYSAGIGAHRPSAVAYLLITLIVILAFLILDLDRPRRGLINVSQSSMRALKAQMDADKAAGR